MLGLLSLLAAAAPAFGLEVGLDGPVVLGEVEQVPVVIRAPESAATEGRPLRVSVNVGAFSPLERTAPGEYRSTFQLPDTRHPQVALVAVWRETGPDAPVAFLRIPLFGKTTLPVTTQPSSEVRVTVGDQEFGPVTADQRGRAAVAIVVPPGLEEVVATSVVRGTQSQVRVSTGVPAYNRLTLAVTPYLIPADGKSSCTVLAYYDFEGDLPIAQVRIDVEGGSIAVIGREEKVYRYRFVPRRNNQAKEARLRVRVKGDRVSSAEALLSLGTPVPEKIVAQPLDQPLVADGTSSANLVVAVVDRLGLGVPGRTLTATSSWLRVESIEEKENGVYWIRVRTPNASPSSWTGPLDVSLATDGGAPVRTSVNLAVAAPPWPTAAELSLPSEVPVSDGSTPFRVEMYATDAAGRAFRGARLKIESDSGAVTALEEIGDGQYRASIVPAKGASELELSIRDETGHLEVLQFVALRAPRPRLTLGAGAGLVRDAKLTWTVMAEVGVRPKLLEERLRIYGGAAYHRISTEVVGLDRVPTITARLTQLSMFLGVTYDAVRWSNGDLYLGGGAHFLAFEHDPGDPSVLRVERGISPGFEILLGGEIYGLFLELRSSFAALGGADDFTRPKLGWWGLLGYRLTVF